jgi:hypothetical protein
MDAELDRLLADDLFTDLAGRPVAELRALRGECQAVETQLSYLRRLVQGRHDIVTGEIERRRVGGDPDDLGALVDQLPQILSDRIHAPGPGHLPTTMEAPGDLSGRLVDRLDEITEAVPVDDSPDGVPDDQLATAAVELGDLEQEVSSLRRAMFDRIDAIQAEVTRRYRDGEAQVDDLLASGD